MADKGQYLTAVDLGASKVGAVVCAIDGRMLGISASRIPGWPGKNFDPGGISTALHSALTDACGMAGVRPPRRIWVSVSGARLSCQTVKNTVKVAAADHTVTPADLKRAAGAPAIGEFILEKCLTHTSLDGRDFLEDPIGKRGTRLEVSVLFMQLERGQPAELKRLLEMNRLEAYGFVAGDLAGAAVLTPAEKEIGSALFNLGASHTSVMVFARGGLRHYADVPLGGIHVTKDLAVALGLPIERAEELKIGAARAGEIGPSPMRERAITARVCEILEMARRELERAGWYGRLPGGCVLTGGGALMTGLADLAAQVLTGPIRIGLPLFGAGQEITASPVYATLLGLPEMLRQRAGGGQQKRFLPKEVGRWRSKWPPCNSPA